jgi:hypothetical protein
MPLHDRLILDLWGGSNIHKVRDILVYYERSH